MEERKKKGKEKRQAATGNQALLKTLECAGSG